MSKYWRVTFTPEGAIRQVRQVKVPNHSRWVIVEARDEEHAKRKAYNLYCARKKSERTQKLHAVGQCVCGRKQDRTVQRGRYKGQWAKTCSVCAERMTVWRGNYAERQANGTVGQGMAERDEVARISLNLERQRDRKSEMRLEVLVEVRNQWINSPNLGRFSKWLEREIDAITGARASA